MRFAICLVLALGWSCAQASHLRMEVRFSETYEKTDSSVYQLKSTHTKVVSRLKLSAFTLFPKVKETEASAELTHKRLILDSEHDLITYQILDAQGQVASEAQLEYDREGRQYRIKDDHTVDYVKQAYVKNPYGRQFSRLLGDDANQAVEVDIDDIKCKLERDASTLECSQKINFEQEL